MTRSGRVLLHMPQHLADEARLPQFYRTIARGLHQRGAEVAVVHRQIEALQGLPPGPDFHLVHNGAAQGACLLNCAVAYLAPYFYADPQGIYFESRVTSARFDPTLQPEAQMMRRFQMLRARYVEPRISRYAQPAPVQSYPIGAIAVFLQDWSEPVARARHMTAAEMVQTVVAGAMGRPVVIKPHPRTRGLETLELLQDLALQHPEVIVTEGNLHDILASAAVCVTISSSVALEAMLHRKPVVLFGRSDLHHCASTVRQAADWPEALRRALSQDWPYEAFVYWFCEQHLRGGKDMIAPLLTRMRAAGADFAALGL
ncbi:MAG: hypothetical protein U1A24_18610 [Cypionkella sp.]|nr:hypothetical protein [Cypionkella sp.]